jgi:hypothetical protein
MVAVVNEEYDMIDLFITYLELVPCPQIKP